MPLNPIEEASFPTLLDGYLTTLEMPYSSGSGSMVVNNAGPVAAASPTSEDPVKLSVYRMADGAVSHYLCTAVSGNTLAVAVTEGYTDYNFAAQDQVGSTASAETFAAIESAIQATQVLVNQIVTVVNEGGGGGGGSGTVTSVALTVPSGLSVSGSPITSSGTFAITTGLSGVLKGTGSGFAAAAAGTDYVSPSGLATALTPYATSTYVGSSIISAIAALDLGTASQHAASDFLTPTGNGSGLTGLTGSQIAGNIAGQAGTVATIAGLIAAGSNVTITGSGTSGGPYTIAASGGGGGSPAGSNLAIQYNSSGSFGGASNVVIADGGGLFSSGAINGSESTVGAYLGTYASGRAAVAFNDGGGVQWSVFLYGQQLWFYNPAGEANLQLLGFEAVFSGTVTVEAVSGQSDPLFRVLNSSGSQLSTIDLTGAFNPPSMADSAANDNSLYYSTTGSKLAYKDPSGTVHTLY